MGTAAATFTLAAAVAELPVAVGAGDTCWELGFTRGQCCNAIFGEHGNPYCWDHGVHTFETCCGTPFFAQDCAEFIANFAFSVLRTHGDALDRCAQAMEQDPGRCNSANMSGASCPSCASLSEHLVTYVRCVREEQARRAPKLEAGRDEPGGAEVLVGGAHYPTMLRPRSLGREFTWVAPAFDAYVGTQLVHHGHWNPEEVRLLRGLLPKGGIAVDAGANIGAFTLPLAQHVGPHGEIHAFEPFRLIYQTLAANCALNGLQSCFCHHKALGSHPAHKRLRMPGLNAIGNPSKMYVADHIASELHIHYDRDLQETVEVVRLDDFPLRRLDLIKIDVESMELELLVGADTTLRRFRPLLYVEDSEADMESMREPTRLIRHLASNHHYACLNLAQTGAPSLTSLLCAPQETMPEVQTRMRRIDLTHASGV